MCRLRLSARHTGNTSPGAAIVTVLWLPFGCDATEWRDGRWAGAVCVGVRTARATGRGWDAELVRVGPPCGLVGTHEPVEAAIGIDASAVVDGDDSGETGFPIVDRQARAIEQQAIGSSVHRSSATNRRRHQRWSTAVGQGRWHDVRLRRLQTARLQGRTCAGRGIPQQRQHVHLLGHDVVEQQLAGQGHQWGTDRHTAIDPGLDPLRSPDCARIVLFGVPRSRGKHHEDGSPHRRVSGVGHISGAKTRRTARRIRVCHGRAARSSLVICREAAMIPSMSVRTCARHAASCIHKPFSWWR